MNKAAFDNDMTMSFNTIDLEALFKLGQPADFSL